MLYCSRAARPPPPGPARPHDVCPPRALCPSPPGPARIYAYTTILHDCTTIILQLTYCTASISNRPEVQRFYRTIIPLYLNYNMDRPSVSNRAETQRFDYTTIPKS